MPVVSYTTAGVENWEHKKWGQKPILYSQSLNYIRELL